MAFIEIQLFPKILLRYWPSTKYYPNIWQKKKKPNDILRGNSIELFSQFDVSCKKKYFLIENNPFLSMKNKDKIIYTLLFSNSTLNLLFLLLYSCILM